MFKRLLTFNLSDKPLEMMYKLINKSLTDKWNRCYLCPNADQSILHVFSKCSGNRCTRQLADISENENIHDTLYRTTDNVKLWNGAMYVYIIWRAQLKMKHEQKMMTKKEIINIFNKLKRNNKNNKIKN